MGDFNMDPNTEVFAELSAVCTERELMIADVTTLPPDIFTRHIDRVVCLEAGFIMSSSLHVCLTS